MTTITVSSGQTWSVSSGETDNGDVVLAGGTLVVGSGGTAISDAIYGTEFVVSGGFSSGATVLNGGVEAVYDSGSQVLNDVISSGGTELVSAGGTAVGSIVKGVEFVQNGGQAFGADVEGHQIVQSGGVATNDLIGGGLVDVQAGGLAFVTFTSNGGILELDASQVFSGTVAGFASPAGVNEAIDLGDIAFTSATTVNFTEAANKTSGTLSVTNGSETTNLTLLGQYTAANFTLSSDGHGGTLVTDPPSQVGSPAGGRCHDVYAHRTRPVGLGTEF
jgi:autotransporter passenger strand-loop-strand repeat protein